MPTDNSSVCLICRWGATQMEMAKFSIESLLSPRTFCCGPLRSSPPPPPVTEELRPEFGKRINVGAALSKDILNPIPNDNRKLSVTGNSNFLSSLLASTMTHQMPASAFGLHAPLLQPALLNGAIGPSAFTHIGPQFFGTVFPGPTSHPYNHLFAPSHPSLLAAGPHYTNGKRKRRHRTIFSEEQLQILETTFLSTRYPDVGVREKLAMQCDLKEERVEVWFKNRRAKERKKSRDAVTLSSPSLSSLTKGQSNGGANTGSRLSEGSSSSEEIDDDENDAEEGEWEGEEAAEVGQENSHTAAIQQRAKISTSTQEQKDLVAIKRKRVNNPHSAPPKRHKRDTDRPEILKTSSRSTTSTASPKAPPKKEIND